MIISQSRAKVKTRMLNFLNRLRWDLSKPVLKFVTEMVMGMLLTGSCNINLIAAHLKEQIEVKDTIKRLHRVLLKGCVLLKLANDLSVSEAVKKIDKDTKKMVPGELFLSVTYVVNLFGSKENNSPVPGAITASQYYSGKHSNLSKKKTGLMQLGLQLQG